MQNCFSSLNMRICKDLVTVVVVKLANNPIGASRIKHVTVT